jgi:cytochrome c1
MKKLLTTASVLVGLTISFNLLANSDIHLDHADTNIRDQKSLQNGAQLFMNYCSGCQRLKEIVKPTKTDAVVNNFFILFLRYSFRHFFGFSNRSKPWH